MYEKHVEMCTKTCRKTCREKFMCGLCRVYSHVELTHVWKGHLHVEHAQTGQLSETVTP